MPTTNPSVYPSHMKMHYPKSLYPDTITLYIPGKSKTRNVTFIIDMILSASSSSKTLTDSKKLV